MMLTVYCVSRGFIRGPGDNPKPLAFAFHNKFKQGPLLSVVNILFLQPGTIWHWMLANLNPLFPFSVGALVTAAPTLFYFVLIFFLS